jgi:hypothetical protein
MEWKKLAVSIFRIATVVAFLVFGTIGLHAQQAGSGSISGIVTDPSGAVVTGAEIRARNVSTNITRSARTSATGAYVLPELAPGAYELKIIASGFAERLIGVQVAVSQVSRADVALGIQGETTKIALDDLSPPLVNTSESVVAATIDSRTIAQLPLNGRNYLELALLIPGNAPAPNFDPTKLNTVQISSAGQLGRGGNVTIDGADNNDDVVGGALQNLPQDAVQEFQIATNRFSAEFGRTGSTVINVVTKSGSNALRGSLSFFERDAALQGLPATFDRTLGTTPPFDRQQYSATIGGPLVRDKAWWFTGFEYRNQDGAVLVGERDLATRTIRRTFAPAPLDDLLFTPRADWQIGTNDLLSVRYSLERFDGVDASSLIRAIGSASQRQRSRNNYQALSSTWTRTFSPRVVNRFGVSLNNFINNTDPVQPSPQLTFPSLQDGASFRVPQQTRQNRWQFSDALTWVTGNHTLRFGGEFQRIDADFDLRVFQSGRIELVEDFASFDHNQDGIIDDNDLLFAVTLRSAFPDRPLIIPDADNNYMAFFVQDDWRVHPQFTLNLGLRYELDTDVKNIGHVDDLNPIILPYLHGTRGKDINNFGPRIGANWATKNGDFSVHAGYGIYYDRVTLELNSLERGLDGRALPVEVRAGNVFFVCTGGPPVPCLPPGTFAPGAPTLANPFTGFILPGAGAGGINIIDNDLQNPMVQQFNLGVQQQFLKNYVIKADFVHNLGTHFIIGRPLSPPVFNPVVGGPDVVKNLESSVNTKYDALLLTVHKQLANHVGFDASYTLAKAFNYANDDQIPFANGPLDPNNLGREYGPTPNDQRHRFVFSGLFELPYGFRVAPIWTIASGVPMDILVPDASTRVPEFQRNAGGRAFHSASDLNAALTNINAGLPVAEQLPLVSPDAQFNDSFNSLDLRFSKAFSIRERVSIEGMVEVFNLFNVTNILGMSNQNYSGFSNVLVRDSSDHRGDPGYLRSSSFGRPVTTAGGVFGSGGPRAFQLGVRFSF